MASKPNLPRIGVQPGASAVARVSAPPAPAGHDGTLTAALGHDATLTEPLGHDATLTAPLGRGGARTTPDKRAAAPAPNLELRAGATIKHYEVLRPLGRGGMGAVFLARDTKLGRLVAIKILREQSPQGARRLLAEARATARCKHENIVVIHEVDEFGGRPYLVLEYLEGRTLRAWLAAGGSPGAPPPPAGGEDAGERVAPGQAIELMIPVVRALACAHASGIVHRDLKPENIFLTDAGPIKVLDFGIAKQLGVDELAALAAPGEPGAELTGPGELVGTLTYMAPEQWSHAKVDPRTDLWAVGVLLYRLVAGVHPLGPAPSLYDLAQLASPEPPVPSVLTRCPTLGPLAALIDRCLRKAPAERFASAGELLAALEALGPARPRGRGVEGESPFVGLAALQEADAPHFFGREGEVSGALGRWQSQPLLAIAGPSGAGKSSFARAGLIPAFKRAFEPTEAFVVRPGRRPLAALADVLARAALGGAPGAGDAEGLVATLRAQPGLLGTRLRERCRRLGERSRLVLFVDQFEELYSLGAPAEERAAFVACLQGVADDASSPLRVLLSLRSDFLDRTAEDGPFATEVTRGLVLLRPMGREGLAEALTRPLEAVGYHFEDEALARSMLDELARARSPLPLLQFTAALLWQARDRDRRLLPRASYERLGGVAGALSAHADATLAALSPPERGLCREIFLRLVTPERTRAVVGLDELRALGPGGDAVASVVGRLADARLVLVEPSGGAEGPTVELVHESLLDRWATLKRWLDESAQDAHFLARLRAAARAWQAGGEAEGLLWRERAADEARAWLARRGAERGHGATAGPDEGEERYLRAVVALSGRARRRRRAAVASVIAALGAIALLVSLLAVRSRREARRAGEEAARTRAEAARADAAAAFARNAARLTAAHELQASDPTTALAFLREVESPGVPDDWAEQAFLALHGGVSGAVIAHESAVFAAAFSPDGGRIVTASHDKTVRVWAADGRGEPIVLRGHDDSVVAARFSPDGRRIVSASRDGTARVWNADGAGAPVVLRGHGDQIAGAAFSPDGARVVTASWDGTARVWNADGAGAPLVLRGHGDKVYSAAFSPDGRRVVTASHDRTARVWNADGTGKPLVLRGHGEPVRTAEFSPDGRRVVTASHDRTARVWNVEDARAAAKRPAVYRHEDGVWSAAFSPDGHRIVIATETTARIWSIDGVGEPVVLRGHGDLVRSAAFSPDGRRVVTASFDHTARVWDADGAGRPLVVRARTEAFTAVTFSPDGRRFAASSLDKTVRVWAADGRGEPIVLRGHDDRIFSATFGPDGRRIVTGSQDRTARVWSADGAGKPLVLRGHGGTVIWATFSPDGRRIATASFDRTARVWSADGAGEPLVLRGHGDALTAVAFSPDGARLATASQDRTARVWAADGRGEPIVLRGHDDWVESIAFSPDGRRIVTASDDKTARVWSADGTGEPLVLRGHRDKVGVAAFSPDGARIATASRDGTLRLWRADGTGEPLVLRGHDKEVTSVSFSPDGRRIATTSEDRTLRIWPDLTPLRGYDDPALWAATSYCPSVERRVELLHAPAAAARADFEACERRVRARRVAHSYE
ncbi:MAG TPA: protein kinase [Polyangiaceae bacterium]|nr:protein kinase [Polyangiaceae bacterium]